MIYLDTHVVAWLYAGRVELVPPAARALIEGNELWVSPMVGLELEYLFEIGRTREPAAGVLAALGEAIGLAASDLPFAEVAQSAWMEKWTRDPFDRLVVAHARRRGAPLVTKDETIRRHYSEAIWD